MMSRMRAMLPDVDEENTIIASDQHSVDEDDNPAADVSKSLDTVAWWQICGSVVIHFHFDTWGKWAMYGMHD